MRPRVNVRTIVLGVLLLIAIIFVGGYSYLRRSLPAVDGTIEVAGISGAIEIIRDADAIPHIFASTRLDALYGLGYVHAQDRLWQMEFQRRIGQGRLSEIFGDATLKQDRFLRTVGFGRAARTAWDRLPRDTREQIDAYVAGVNAFIASHRRGLLPPEFLLLRFEPEPWSGPDVLVWVKMMAWDLSANYSTELLRQDIVAHVGVDRMNELLPPYPPNGLNILSASPEGVVQGFSPALARLDSGTGRAKALHYNESTASYAAAFSRTLAAADPAVGRLLLGGGGATEGLGSNNWVVDGTLTASGKPLLANDPHLGTQVPSLWYLAHMTAGDFDVIGATLPGAPAVAIGRNRFIAWGETNMFADVEDLYRERLDPSGRSAEFKGIMEPLRLITETIGVKGAAAVNVDVRISRHGPLVSDAINANNGNPTDPKAVLEPLAFRWSALDDDDRTIVAFLRVNDAHNWTDFTAALRDFVVPSQNFVYADVDGHIGYYAPGHIPIRAGGAGLLPADGWSGAMEWAGWIPFDELPHSYDPSSHFIVTANNRPVPPGYKYALGFEYHEPYRAQRITDLVNQKIRQKTGLTPDDFRAIQSDTFSLHAQTLLPRLLEHVHPESPQDTQAVDLLRQWKFDAGSDSAAPALFEAWFLGLAPALVGGELGPDVTATYERRFTFITRFVMNALATGSSGFCGHAPTRKTCDELVTVALHDGVNRLARELKGDMARWRWEDVHPAVFPHQGLDTVPVLHWLLSRHIPNRGDWSTVNVGAVDVAHPFEQREIPGYRQIVDLSPANDSRYLASMGQSGHFLSPHYDDEMKNWHDVRHLPMRMERVRIEQGAIGHLRLVPR